MVHGIHFQGHRHPPFARMTGEKSLNATAILLIAVFILVLAFYAALGYL